MKYCKKVRRPQSIENSRVDGLVRRKNDIDSGQNQENREKTEEKRKTGIVKNRVYMYTKNSMPCMKNRRQGS